MSTLHDNSRSRSTDNLTLGQRSRTRHTTYGDSTNDPLLFRTRSMAAASVSTRSADLSQRVNRVEEGIYDIKGQLNQLLGNWFWFWFCVYLQLALHLYHSIFPQFSPLFHTSLCHILNRLYKISSHSFGLIFFIHISVFLFQIHCHPWILYL